MVNIFRVISRTIYWSLKTLGGCRDGIRPVDKAIMFINALLYPLSWYVLSIFYWKKRRELCIVKGWHPYFFLIKKPLLVKGVSGLRFWCFDGASYEVTREGYEEHVEAELKISEGHVFIDVGAHIGRFTLLGAKLVRERQGDRY